MKTNKQKPGLTRLRRSGQDDGDDPYADDENDVEYKDDVEDSRDDNVDLDMLPTMLVYRGGDLVHNWVRVDWEAGHAGLEELLGK